MILLEIDLSIDKLALTIIHVERYKERIYNITWSQYTHYIISILGLEMILSVENILI